MEPNQTSNFSTTKEAINTIQRQSMDWEKYLQMMLPTRPQFSKYTNNSYNSKQTNKQTNGQKT